MFIYTTNGIIDPDKEPVLIVFEDKEDKEKTIINLINMIDSANTYAIFPGDYDLEEIKRLAEEAKKLI